MAIVISSDDSGNVTVTEDGVEKTLFPNTDDFNKFATDLDSLESALSTLESDVAMLSLISGVTIDSDKWEDVKEVFDGMIVGYTYPVLIMPDAIKLITNNAITSSGKGIVGAIAEGSYDIMLMLGNDRIAVFRISDLTDEGVGTVSTIKVATMTTLS